MPVMTRFLDPDGSYRPLRWGWWHLDCFQTAIELETREPANPYSADYTFLEYHRFEDPTDGEIMEIHPGCRYFAGR